MGMTPDSTGMSTGMSIMKGGLTGLSQGLANYNNPHPRYDFSGLTPPPKPKVIDLSDTVNKESVIPKPYTGDDQPNQPDLQVGNDPDAQAARLRMLSQLFRPQNPPPRLGSQDAD